MNLPHEPTFKVGQSRISGNKIDRGPLWNPPSGADLDQSCCLGSNKSYPIMRGGKVNENALILAESHAVRNGHPEIANRAKHLLAMIKDKPVAMAAEDETNQTGLVLDADGGFEEALVLGSDLPKEKGGIPVFHYWKETLTPGTFNAKTPDGTEKKWTITPKDIDDAIADANLALSLGWEPPIKDAHYNATKSLGSVVGYRKNDRGGMEWLHQFLGEQNRIDGLAKKTSLMLLPDAEPQGGGLTGKKFKWFPDHSASVFRSQLKHLRDFQSALAASGQPVDAVYLSLADADPQGDIMPDLSKFRAALALADSTPDEQVLATALAELATNRKKIADAEASVHTAELALSDQEQANAVLIGQLDEAKALTLSDEDGPSIIKDPTLLAMAKKNVTQAIALGLRDNQIDQSQAEWLSKAAAEAPALMLAADDDGFNQVEHYINFAAMRKDRRGERIASMPPITRGKGQPVTKMPTPPATPLALAGEDDAPKAKMGESERAAMLAMCGY